MAKQRTVSREEPLEWVWFPFTAFSCNRKSIQLLTEDEYECFQNTGSNTRLQHRLHYSVT